MATGLIGACTPGTAVAPSAAGSAAPAAAHLPCDVEQILASNCQSCHGATPLNGAPMPLVTWADLTAAARTDATHKVFELVSTRVADRARPMPPDPTKRLSEAAIGVLQHWAAAGALPGSQCLTTSATAGSGGRPTGVGQAGAAAVGGMVQTGNTAGSAPGAAGHGGAAAGSGGSSAPTGTAGSTGSVAPNDADIETCYELRAHGQSAPGDKSKYTVPVGETYTGFIFKAPWPKPVQGLRFRHLPDNAAVLHHWLIYSESDDSLADGDVESCELGGLTGILCGQASTRSLITGWAPGRGDFRLPGDVGLELPAPGKLLAIEVHYNNASGSMTMDQSGVEVCVTSKFRPNTAAVTWLGTQTIDLAAHEKGTAAGTCKPLRNGMNDKDPIHVLFSWPHMHKLGRHMTSVVNRSDGSKQMMYDGDFSFEFQVLYDTPVLLAPGDSVTTTCTFDNTTDESVTFGQSTNQEMCYNFTYAWPAHAIDNPGAEIGGADNTCLH